MELSTIEKQKKLTQYIRNVIKENGDPYDFDVFEFNVDERRDCLNWMTFLGLVNEVEDAVKNNLRLNKKYIEDIEEIAQRYLVKYYTPKFRNLKNGISKRLGVYIPL